MSRPVITTVKRLLKSVRAMGGESERAQADAIEAALEKDGVAIHDAEVRFASVDEKTAVLVAKEAKP